MRRVQFQAFLQQQIRSLKYIVAPTMKQEVINYEFQILQNQMIHNNPPSPASHSFPFRYSHWKLSSTLHSIADSIDKELKWIGNSETSFIISFFYCLFKISAGKQDILMKLKHSLYKVCQYCLNLSQQKSIVEFIGLLSQQDPLISNYLLKHPHIQDLLVKIYNASAPIVHTQSTNSSSFDHFSILKEYSELLFNFLAVEGIKDCRDALEIRISQRSERIYILREKGCYFILQGHSEQPKAKIKSLQHRSPIFQECIIIDEEAEQDQTILRESKNQSGKKSPLKSRSTPQAGSVSQSPFKKQQRKVPQFLNQQNKQRGKRKSLNEDECRKNKSNNYKKISFPIKQKINKKVFPNYLLKESKHAVPVNSLNKSRENSPKNKKGKILPPPQIKEKQKNKLQYKPQYTVHSSSTIAPSMRYIHNESEDHTKPINKQRKIPNSQQTSINTQHQISSQSSIYPPQVRINYPFQKDVKKRSVKRESESPVPVPFHYEYHIGR